MLGVDLVETGFETADIDGLMLLNDDEDLAAGEVSAPQPLETAISRLGDIWLLGDHRLANGDAREAMLYDRLMPSGEFAQLVLTDEPYNVANVGHVTSNADHREFAFAHGEMSRQEFGQFNRQWMEAVLPRLADGGLFATFIDWRSVELVIACGCELGLDLINVVVWVKTNGGQGRCGVLSTSCCRCSRRAASLTLTMSNSAGTAAGDQTFGNTRGRQASGRTPERDLRFTRL